MASATATSYGDTVYVQPAQYGQASGKGRVVLSLPTALGGSLGEKQSLRRFEQETSTVNAAGDICTIASTDLSKVNQDGGVAVDPVRNVMQAEWARRKAGDARFIDDQGDANAPTDMGSYVLAQYTASRFEFGDYDPATLSQDILSYYGQPSNEWTNWCRIFPQALSRRKNFVPSTVPQSRYHAKYNKNALASAAAQAYVKHCHGDIRVFGARYLSQFPPLVPLIDYAQADPQDDLKPAPYGPATSSYAGKNPPLNADKTGVDCARGGHVPIPDNCGTEGLAHARDSNRVGNLSNGDIAIIVGGVVCAVVVLGACA